MIVMRGDGSRYSHRLSIAGLGVALSAKLGTIAGMVLDVRFGLLVVLRLPSLSRTHIALALERTASARSCDNFVAGCLGVLWGLTAAT